MEKRKKIKSRILACCPPGVGQAGKNDKLMAPEFIRGK